MASLVAAHLAVFCNLQKIFSFTAGAWLQVCCSSRQVLFEWRSYHLVPGFSSAVSGLSFHQLPREEGTPLPSRKYLVSFTDVHKDVSKTFYYPISCDFLHSWPDQILGSFTFCPFWKKGSLSQQKSKPFMNFIHNCIIDSSPGGLEDVYSFVVVSCLYYTYPHSLPVSEILSFPPPSLHRLCALTAGNIPVKYTSCNLPPLEAALPIFLQHFLYQHWHPTKSQFLKIKASYIKSLMI